MVFSLFIPPPSATHTYLTMYTYTTSITTIVQIQTHIHTRTGTQTDRPQSTDILFLPSHLQTCGNKAAVILSVVQSQRKLPTQRLLAYLYPVLQRQNYGCRSDLPRHTPHPHPCYTIPITTYHFEEIIFLGGVVISGCRGICI